jgi:hypothetical protein
MKGRKAACCGKGGVKVNDEPKVVKSDSAEPCPFCRSQPTIQPWHGGGPLKRLVSCDNQDCLVRPLVTGNTRKAALDNWNHRAIWRHRMRGKR